MNSTNMTNATTLVFDEDDLAFVPWVLDEVCEDVPDILLRPGTFCEPISVVALALLVYVAVLVWQLVRRLISAAANKAKEKMMKRSRKPSGKTFQTVHFGQRRTSMRR